ncbi:MAG: hypothetical protein JO127_03135 [Caulobacteraceae bacterium]|nr:hypothetical protein [Caulobacteraceae bacterium]
MAAQRAALIGVLLLGGCNLVMTTQPMFGPADAAGAPRLRPGVWNGPPDPACPYDETKPVAAWPACANGGLVSEGQIRARQDLNGASAGVDYILAAGDPLILQLRGLEPAPGSGISITRYFYAGLRPARTDAQGRIIAYDAWLVLCGPPSRKAVTPDAPATRSPFPGLVMDPSGQACGPRSAAALRGAAAASRRWPAAALGAHWVRDGDR